MTAPPIKTPDGQEELRLRKRKLGQRYRTFLLLVDGKRSRSEVLQLGAAAGVPAALFDELLEMGLIEHEGGPLTQPAELDSGPLSLPAELTDSALATLPGDLAEPAAPESAPEPQIPPAVEPAASEVAAPDPLPAVVAPVEVVPEPPAQVDEPAVATTITIELAPTAASPGPVATHWASAGPESAASRDASPGNGAALTVSDPVPMLTERIEVADAFEEPDTEESRLLGEVRGLLIGTLLVDAPVSSSLTALRVHRARDRESLVRLVWEVERSLGRVRRPREAQSRLSRARDLLGLGNTVVHEHTLPGRSGYE